jgi:putative hydrolase of the HAD superfamily
MAVRAALFDLGNTLVGYYRSEEFPSILRHCLRSTIAALGLPLAEVDAEQLFAHAMRLNREREDHAVRPLGSRIRALLQDHIELNDTKLADACQAFLVPIFACARLDVEAPRVLAELRHRGVKTCIVSNTPWGSPSTTWRAELDRHSLLDKVDAVVFCVDVGWRKPHPAPFYRALEHLSVAASEAVFVGDDPRWDVVGAERVGLRPILVSPDGMTGDTRYTVISRLGEVLASINAAPGSCGVASLRNTADRRLRRPQRIAPFGDKQ